MINWREVPFIRLLVPVILGMVCSSKLELQQISSLIPWISLGLLVLLFLVKKYSLVIPFSPFFGLTLTLSLFFFGAARSFQYNETRAASHFRHHLQDLDFLLVSIKKISGKGQKLRIESRVELVADKEECIRKATGNLLVYLPPDSLSLSLQTGDYLLVRGNVFPIPSARNPETFDAARYFHLKNIHYQVFLNPPDWQKYPESASWSLKDHFANYQLKAVATLKKYLKQEREFAVAAALVVGFREAVSGEVRELYTDTGSIHVLAVSGLHLGFIYFGVYWLFSRLFGNQRRWVAWRVFLSLLLLWSFALFTGGSASVLRAATMLSFVLIGQSLGQFCNIYNSLAASAFVLLCLNPFFLWEIGFQLSYLAVLGIVFFHPVIYPTLYLHNALADWLWKLTAVSLAAQITTFPLSLYYFHQFPALFWLSGWLVVTFASIILGLGLLLLACSSIGFVAKGIAFLLYGCIYLVNTALTLIQQIPGGLWENIWVDGVTIGLIYLIMLSLAFMIKSYKMAGLFLALSLSLILSLHLTSRKWALFQQKQVIVYHVSNSSVIDFFAGGQGYSLHSPDVSEKSIGFSCKNYRLSRGIRQVESWPLQEECVRIGRHVFHQQDILQFFDIRMAILDQALPQRPPPVPLEVDYLIVQNSPWIDFENLKEHYRFQTLIADASNTWKSINFWKTACRKRAIDLVDIKNEGAFIIKTKYP